MSGLSLWLLFVVVPNIGCLAGILLIILGTMTVFLGIIWFVTLEDIDECCFNKINQLKNKILFILSIFGLITAITPSQKEMVAITVAPYILNNPNFQKLPDNLAKYLNDLMEDEKEEIL